MYVYLLLNEYILILNTMNAWHLTFKRILLKLKEHFKYKKSLTQTSNSSNSKWLNYLITIERVGFECVFYIIYFEYKLN